MGFKCGGTMPKYFDYNKLPKHEDGNVGMKKTVAPMPNGLNLSPIKRSWNEILEGDIDKYLGYPQRQARELATFDDNEEIDNIRHAQAGRLTGRAIEDIASIYTSPYLPDWLAKPINKGIGFAGSSLAGIAHEIMAIDPNKSWDQALREAAEDIYNNTYGAYQNLKPGIDNNTRSENIYRASFDNRLPDGVVIPNPKEGQDVMGDGQTTNLYWERDNMPKEWQGYRGLPKHKDGIKTYKSDPKYFDNRAVYHDDHRYNELIKKQIYAGTHGYNPETGELVKLDEAVDVPKYIQKLAQPQDIEQQNLEAYIRQGHKQAILNSPFNIAAAFTPVGAGISMLQGLGTAASEASQGNYGAAALYGGLEALPYGLGKLGALSKLTKTVDPKVLYHASDNPALTQDLINVADNAAKAQGNKYSGFYVTDNVGSYFHPSGTRNQLYSMELPGDAKTLTIEGKGAIERLTPADIAKYRAQGYTTIQGKDILGRPETVIVNKDQMSNFKNITETQTLGNISETIPVSQRIKEAEKDLGRKLTEKERQDIFLKDTMEKLKNSKKTEGPTDDDIKALIKQLDRNKLPEYTDEGVMGAFNDFMARIDTPEGKRRAAELGIQNVEDLKKVKVKQDKSTYGYHSGAKQVQEALIGMNPDIPYRNILRHELEHNVQNVIQLNKAQAVKDKENKLGRMLFEERFEALKPTSSIDDMLDKLELRDFKEKTPSLEDILSKPEIWEEPVKKKYTAQMYSDKLSDRAEAKNYFKTGSQGREKSAMLAEVQQYMLDNKLINHAYDNITPEKVKETFIKGIEKNPQNNKSPLRIFNIMRPTENNYKLLSEALNKMLVTTPVVGIGAAAANQEYYNGGNLPKYPDGTITPIYTKDQYQKDIQSNYENYLRGVNYITPATEKTKGGMNCINGVCTVIGGSSQKKMSYIGNQTFDDHKEEEGFYTVDPAEEGFEIGDILQYTRDKNRAGRFEGNTTLANAHEQVPQHAAAIVDKHVREDGTVMYSVFDNGGDEKGRIVPLSEQELLKRVKEGYQSTSWSSPYDGVTVNRYNPEVIAARKAEREKNLQTYKGINKYARDYDMGDFNYTVTRNYKIGSNIPGESYNVEGEDAFLTTAANTYKKIYHELGAGSNMPKETFDRLLQNQLGIAGVESGYNSITPRRTFKETVPEGALSTVRELYDSWKGKEQSWMNDYWSNNINNIQDQFATVEDFIADETKGSKLSKEAKEYLYYNTPRSKGPFQQKELSKRGRFYGYDLDTEEGQIAASAALAVDNYHLIKDKYKNKDLTENQILDLVTLMHNAPSKALSERFVEHYIKNNDVDYVNKVKAVTPKFYKKEEPKKTVITKKESENIMNWINNL